MSRLITSAEPHNPWTLLLISSESEGQAQSVLGLWRSAGMHSPCWGVMIHNYTSADNALSHSCPYHLLTHANMHNHQFVELQEIILHAFMVFIFICKWKHIIMWITCLFFLPSGMFPSKITHHKEMKNDVLTRGTSKKHTLKLRGIIITAFKGVLILHFPSNKELHFKHYIKHILPCTGEGACFGNVFS